MYNEYKAVSGVSQARSGDLVSFQAYVCNGANVKRETKNGEKSFFECDISDDSGTIYGSLFTRSKMENNKYYNFENMVLQVKDKMYKVLETVDTYIQPNNKLSFKIV
jgi:hypothetical protein